MLTARRGLIQHRLFGLPLHPLLAAAYPVVFLFATNAAEQVTLSPLWRPLALSVSTTAATLVSLRLITGGWHRAALLATILVIGFFGYGHVWNAVGDRLDSQWPLIGAWTLLVTIGLYAAWRFRRWAPRATPALNLVAAVLLLMNAWGLTQAVVALGAPEAPRGIELTSLDLAPASGELPDVYYIVPDRYGGSSALAEAYEFNNEPFLRALEERGFAIARHAHANYIKTPLSLVSALNMDFLDDDALVGEQRSGADDGPINRRLRERLTVPAALKEIGYQYLHVANWWEPSATNVDADRTFRYDGQDEFSSALAQTTLLRALDEPQQAAQDRYGRDVFRQHTLYELETLEAIAETAGPKFVFAHLLIPHDPYVFDIDGSPVLWSEEEGLGRIESYGRQLAYTNARLLALVERITEADEDAVILLMADEGPLPGARGTHELGGFRWRTATDMELEGKFGILLAMRVPGADLEQAGFHDSITAVNAWRVIFNARFGTDLPMLPDRAWAHESLYQFFDFFEITDRLDTG